MKLESPDSKISAFHKMIILNTLLAQRNGISLILYFSFSKMRTIWRNHWKSIVWAIIILTLCSIPGNQINKVKIIDIPHLDKFVHFFFYFVFTLLLISENNKGRHHRKVTVDAILIAATISLSYGALIEVLQKIIMVNRGADIWDMVANTFGFIAAAISYRQVNRVTEGYI
ncbi:MAG: hypothetical protein EHM93_17335 [Bacteroidales bacterium]|nr:MAG: hypothetical protein EHM93_17335 [Bacteroidales bacterium]